MKFKLIFFYFFIFSFFSFFVSAQNDKCKLKINYDLSNIRHNGEISFSVTNLSTKKVKVLKEFNSYKTQLMCLFQLDEKNNVMPIEIGTTDIDFFMPEKLEVLKPNKSKVYKLNIFNTYQGSKFLSQDSSYQFDLRFDFIDLVEYKYDCKIIGSNEIKDLKYQRKL